MKTETSKALNAAIKKIGFTHKLLANKLETSRPTLIKKFKSGDWKKFQIKTIQKLGLELTYEMDPHV